MSINALDSASSQDFSAFRSAANLRNFRNNAALSLLPAVSPSKSGLGLGADIYDSVSRQTQGLYTGGRTAMMSAYAALGIDVSEKFHRPAPEAPKADAVAVEAEEPEAAEETVEPEPDRASRNITEELLKESGFVQPEANPYVFRTDFFA
jgi:hypothetical protein